MKLHLVTLLLCLLLPLLAAANDLRRLTLPNRELLSSDKVLYVMQDSEGFLWYATDGGGVCRDDGRQIDVFRSDAEHPDLLGSNNVVCLAEAGSHILIGTTHGANVLDKSDYSIRRLTEVDDKRVDDIIVTADGHWWLTANKKVYEYSVEGKLLRTLDAGDKYIFRLHEDEHGKFWCMQWEGGTLRLDGDKFVQVTTEWPDSIDFSRVTIDCNGRQLVADGFGECYVESSNESKSWFEDTILTREQANAIQQSLHLSARPTAVAISKDSVCWFSTGKDIRCRKQNGDETVISDTKDVSAMAFTSDGTLWLATIFGQLYRYRQGKMVLDEYGSNEYGDGVIAMSLDSLGRLVMVSDRYTRIYDIHRRTLQQQSREADGIYCIELQETKPGERWSSPNREKVVEHLPGWLTSWWMWCIYAIFIVSVGLLVIYVVQLRRQREEFLLQMKNTVKTDNTNEPGMATEQQPVPTVGDEWLKKAIAQVEAHLNDEGYTVEKLSSDMCMSRMTFYRKIQSLTGQSPTEFMRTIRLRRAADLLCEGRMTVTEITYATGFSSISYFSRCFRTMFGVPPTQFGKAKNCIPSLCNQN
jgi:AraC-like DNA-binding protein